MDNSRLKITCVDDKKTINAPTVKRNSRRQEIEATMERMWLSDPEQFNPERTSVQRKRISSTMEALQGQILLKDKYCADLGCGSGKMARLMRDAGARVDAIDVASIALELLKTQDMQHIHAIQDCLPATRLNDHAYDVVVCTEVIGYLNPKEYRLLFAELSRVMKKEGIAVCSTSLDLNSENALERFAMLAETEFEIEQWILRYDLLWIKCCRFLEAPAFFVKTSLATFERNKELNQRKSLSYLWLKINTTKPCALFWRFINVAAKPMAFYFKQSNRWVNFLEKITKTLWDESGVSHALFIGKKRPMVFPLSSSEVPLEIKHKRQVWE